MSARVQRIQRVPRLRRAPRAGAAEKTADHQRLRGERMRERARRWEDVRQRDDPFSIIDQDRQARALEWIDGLRLPPGSQVLEVGTGAGFMTVALAQREFMVQAADTTPRLLDVARDRVAAAGVASRVRLMLADEHRLPFADRGFSLVVALGVVPWLRSAPLAVAEMARVLRPGGYLVLNADNPGRLGLLLDPRHNPALAPARLAARSLLHSTGMPRPSEQATVVARRLAEFDAIVKYAGLELLKRSTFGFGPFTMFGLPMAAGRAGLRLNVRLQRLADQGLPGLRSAGAQYLVLARAPVAADTMRASDPMS
jgi:ubiquinone/menaquinone biosynthesis C-methylase UbiE